MSVPSINIANVTPATYGRAPLGAFDAVTMWSPENGFSTINYPGWAFFPANGGVTVTAHPRMSPDETVKSTDSNAYLHSVIYKGEVYPVTDTGLLDDLLLLLLALNL